MWAFVSEKTNYFKTVPPERIVGPYSFYFLHINDMAHAFSHVLGLYADYTSIIVRSIDKEFKKNL